MSYYTSDNIKLSSPQGLDPIPEANVVGLPYNLVSTPLIGTPNADTLSSEFLAYYSDLSTRMANSSESVYLPAGSGPGYRGEATDEFVAQQWQVFFYVFQPFVTDEVFTQTRDSLADEGVTYSNESYYKDLFEGKFTDWMNYRRANSSSANTSGTDAAEFRNYLNNQTEMGYRQRSVIMWQILRVIDMLEELQPRAINAGTRQVIWNEGALKAVTAMAARNIPAIRGSSEDVRVPSPDSIAQQHNVMMDIERDRSAQKQSEEKARTDEAIMTFAGDATSQQKATLQSFWSSLQTILGSIIN